MPTVEFKLFSSDATGSPPDPDTALTAITLPFPKNLRNKESESIFEEPSGRGSVHETLSGIVVQDFGIPSNSAGGRIYLEDFEALTESVKNALEAAYAAESTSWYFTDGIDYYEVQFSRDPCGLHTWVNYAYYAATGIKIFSYKMELVVTEKVT